MTTYVCGHCCHPFTKEVAFDNHFPACSKNLRQVTRFPSEDKQVVKFTQTYATDKHPFVIYADLECCLSPTDDEKIGTYALNTHEPSGFCIYTVSKFDAYKREPVVYSGEKAIEKFFDALLIEQQFICTIMRKNVPMLPLPDDQRIEYEMAIACSECKQQFTDSNQKVRHHCHLSGRYLSILCNNCNLKIKYRKRKSKKQVEKELKREFEKDDYYHIPVIMHNLKGYDAHFIIKNFNKKFVEQADGHFDDVGITAVNMEQFISFDIYYLRFIDSVQFLKASLDTLVKNLSKACDDFELFKHTRQHTYCDTKNYKLLCAKGIFPYEWFTNVAKLDETSLPSKDAFFSELNDEGITDEEYTHAHTVWAECQCKTFKKYHDLYMKCDVLLLADVFESFRNMCMRSYGLDPAHFLTLPSFAWASMLKQTKVELRLITDNEMEVFVASSIRGGVSTISHRHVVANNPYVEDYNDKEPSTYIAYLDANNLYGWAMSQYLPFDDFTFLPVEYVDCFDYMNVAPDAHTGYILEVDLTYPDHLHDSHNDYPLAPESLLITHDMLSPFCLGFGQKHVARS